MSPNPQETVDFFDSGFMIFSGGIERHQLHEMGECVHMHKIWLKGISFQFFLKKYWKMPLEAIHMKYILSKNAM